MSPRTSSWRRPRVSLVCAAWIAAAGAVQAGPEATADPTLERGRYLVTVMACGDCHDRGAFTGRPDPEGRLAGSEVGFAGPWGVAYPPNLTSDPETGLGRWNDDQVLRAIRYGQRPGGGQLATAMPWLSYSHLTEEDARAIVAYLRTVPPIHHPVPNPAGPSETPPLPFLGVVEPHSAASGPRSSGTSP